MGSLRCVLERVFSILDHLIIYVLFYFYKKISIVITLLILIFVSDGLPLGKIFEEACAIIITWQRLTRDNDFEWERVVCTLEICCALEMGKFFTVSLLWSVCNKLKKVENSIFYDEISLKCITSGKYLFLSWQKLANWARCQEAQIKLL